MKAQQVREINEGVRERVDWEEITAACIPVTILSGLTGSGNRLERD